MQIPFELEMFNQMFLKIKWKIFHPTLTFEFSASGQKGHLIFLQIRISAPSGLNNKKVLFCWFHWISLVCLSGVLNFRAKRGLNKTVNWKGQIKLKFYRQIKFILQLRNTKHLYYQIFIDCEFVFFSEAIQVNMRPLSVPFLIRTSGTKQ